MSLNARVLCWSASAALSLAGLALATYLSVGYLSGAGVACGVDGGCGAVTTSEYSRFLGILVALPTDSVAAYMLCSCVLFVPVSFAVLPRWYGCRTPIHRGIYFTCGAGADVVDVFPSFA